MRFKRRVEIRWLLSLLLLLNIVTPLGRFLKVALLGGGAITARESFPGKSGVAERWGDEKAGEIHENWVGLV